MTIYRTPQSLIAMIRRAGGARGRQVTGRYSIEGIRLVERALRAGAPLEAVIVAERMAKSTDPRHRDLFDALHAAACPVTIVPDSILNDLTEGRDLGPILGLVQLPPPVTLADLLFKVTSDELRVTSLEPPQPPPPCSPAPPLFLAAVDIVDPGNVGALTRTAHAAGAAALLAAGVSDPFHPRATRIGRGSIYKLPVIQYESAAALLADIRAHDILAVAATAADGIPLPGMVWPDRAIAVLMGNEAEGLPPEVMATVDVKVTIPMAVGVDSYSVNAAAAIVLFVAKQARKNGG
jgi:TrmH family RNA methyltransferase